MKKFIRLNVFIFTLTFLSSALFAQNKDWLLKMQDPNVNFWELQKEFNDYWKDRTDYKGNGYKVFKRWEYINEVRALPDGKLQAPDQVMKEYERYMAEAPLQKSASGTWNIVGPVAYPANATPQPTGKGRINAIAFHPSDVNTLFIGAPSGGIWKSTNNGANWTSLSANIPYLGVSAILIHPANPNIIYIGTGDRDSEDAPGVGVYKTTDGGTTWVQMNSGMGNTTVGMMLMHPSDPNTIIAATYDGIFKTTNGGVSWALTQAGDFRDIKFKPGDPDIVYATRMVTPSEFYRSADNGDTWTPITIPTAGVGSRMVIGVSPANPAYVYLVQIKSLNRTFQALLRSTDSGLTFTEQSNSPNIFDYACDGSGTASQATYDLVIDVDQTDAEIVYVGSINSWKSTNGGVNWSPVTHWVGSGFAPLDPTANCAASVHADHHWFQWSPLHSPARLYLGHDGGIAYTADGGTTWTDISTDLPIGQVYKIGQSPHTANTVLAGFQDNGVSATNNGGSSFTTIAGGDGMECAVDYSNANFCYRETQEGTLRRSTTGVFGSYGNIISTLTDEAAFVAPYMLHRNTPSTMFFGRENLWRSTNVKSTPSNTVIWEAISAFAAGTTIRVMEQSPANLNIFYMSRGSSSSVLYRSDNVNAAAASVVWTVITKPNGLTVTDIKAHPNDENIVYATAGMKVFKSSNKGVNWTDITGNLPALFVNCLVLDRDANEGIYIGNQTGVWYKDATISEWVLFSSGLPAADIRELEIYYDANPNNSRLCAATYGRGIWQSDLIQINVINPSNLAAIPYSAGQIDLSWTLNASSNNVLIATSPTTTFGVPADGTAYTSGNSLPGGGTVVYVGNLTNFSHTGLMAGTTYCYKIWSVNGSSQYSAGQPPVCASTFSHDWTGNVNTDWFNTGNWGPGTVPTATDGAYIPAGRSNYPFINAAGATCYHLTIESGASLSMSAATSFTLQVTGDWLNNGTFTRGIGTVAFTGTNALQTIKGTSTSDFYILQVSKGSADNILDAVSPITLNATVDAPLDLLSGTFRLSNAASNITAIRANGSSAANTIGSGKRFWVAAGTLNVNSSWRLNIGGELKITGGTVNVGNAVNQSLDYLNFGKIVLESGALNVSAGIWGNASGLTSTGVMEISGGTMNLGVFGNGSSRGMLEVNANCNFTMSGGTIVFRRGNGHTHQYYNLSSNQSVTGGTIQIGDASTPVNQTIRINSTTPVYNLTVNATNAPTAQLLTNDLTVKNDVTISGGTLNANSLNLNVGGHWTNDGTFTPGAGTVTFNGLANQNLTGSTATTFNILTMNNAAGLTLSGSVNTTVNGTLNLTSGVISTGANRVIIPASGSVTRTAGHIFGKLQKNVATGSNVTCNFEIGDAASANYTPASLTFASVSAAGDLIAQAVSGDHPQIGSATLNASKSVNRYWSLTNSGTSFTTCDAVFNFLTADLDPSANTADLICGKYDAPNWTSPNTGTKTANSTEITGLTSFSDFQLAEPPCIDPDIPSLSATSNPTCSGQTTSLSIASGNLNNATDWQWYSGSCGGTSVGSGTSVMVSPGSTTTYYVRGEGGCVTPGSCSSITVTVNPLPTPSISGPAAVCSGGDATLDAGAGYAAYAWSNSGGSGQTATFTNITTATTYTVQVTDGNGCTAVASHSVAVNPLPTPSISGPAAVCSGGDATLDAGSGYAVYAWSNSGGAGQTATFTNITTATTYTVQVTDGNGCTAVASHSVTVNPLPTPSISGPATVCSGGDVTLDAGSGYAAYAWSNSGGAGQTATFTNIIAPATYTVQVTDGNGCTAVASHSVTVNPLPTPSISGPVAVCSGGDVTLDAGSGYAAYAWSNSGGAGQTATFTNITASTTYTVQVTDGNGCTGTDAHTVTVNAPNPVITGPGSVCNGGNVTLDAGAGYAAYAWSNSGGSGQTATFTNITAPTTYTVQVTDGNGCTAVASHSVTVNPLPTPSISGPVTVCSGGDVTLDAGAGYAAYAWSNSGGSGQTATFTNITTATTYTVQVTDGNGCTGTDMHTVTIGGSCNLEFSGTIRWEHNNALGVNNATVNLSGAATGNDGTDTNGDFLISVPYTTGNFTVKPAKNINRLNGVTAADVVAIQQHVTQFKPITNPYKMVAADVNRSNSITTLDATLINQCLLGNPGANAIFSVFWRFMPQTWTPVLPPWGFPDKIELTGVSTNQSGLDFYGVKIGDVVANYANPANFGAGQPLVWRVQDRVLQTGETVVADFRADQLDDLTAMQFALRFDPELLVLDTIEPLNGLPLLMENFGVFNKEEGEIRVVWGQDKSVSLGEAAPVFRLRFRALQSGVKLSEVLELNEEILPGRVYNSALAESGVQLRFGSATATVEPAAGLLLLQNRPNPFPDVTTVGFVLPAACEATLRVFDVNGRLLREQSGYYNAGEHFVTFDFTKTDASGVLLCELTTPSGVLAKRMVRVRN